MSVSPDSTPTRGPSEGTALAIWSAVGVSVAITVATALLMAAQPALPGRPTADPVTEVLSLFGDLTARLAAAATLGLLAAQVAFRPLHDDEAAPRADGGAVSRWIVRAGQVWFGAAVFMTFANPAFVVGVPISDVFSPSAWWAFVSSTPSALAWAFSAVVALGIVLVGYRGRSPSSAIMAWLAGAAATLFVAVTGNVSVGLNHDWATDAAGVATVAATILTSGAIGVLVATRGVPGTSPAALRRYQRAVLPLLLVMAGGYGIAAWQQLAGMSPFAVAFGAPVVAGFAVLALLALTRVRGAVALRRRSASSSASGVGRFASASVTPDVVLLIVGMACLSGVAHLAPPRFGVPQDIQINYLGYDVDIPATLERLTGLGRPNLLWVVFVTIAVGTYVWGMVRARRLGRSWPVHRLLAWLGGWGLNLYLAISGLWMYSTAVFSWHMLVHMTINMMVPLLCVLGAPFALVRAATSEGVPGGLPGPRELLDRLGRNRVVRVLLSPPVLWVNYVFSLFVVYFSPIFPWLMRYHWGHQLMLIHFFVAGYAFFTLIVGQDGPAEHLPYIVRFALLVSVMPFHAIFAVGIMMSGTVLGEQYYASIAVSWVKDLLADQNIGGQITWFTGEIPAFIAVVVLAAQWFRSDTRDAQLADQLVDTGESEDELAAYNDILARLAEHDAPSNPTGQAGRDAG
jgi:putative copper resistance protein D